MLREEQKEWETWEKNEPDTDCQLYTDHCLYRFCSPTGRDTDRAVVASAVKTPKSGIVTVSSQRIDVTSV